MPEISSRTKAVIRHRGRLSQIKIFFGKMLRMFIYQNDWKVLPMAVIIAALVSLVVRSDFFVTMEGTLRGAFALTCVAIWNGCFNSIQVVCRERPIIKREHRSGMHITSYIAAPMLYQLIICLLQTGVTMYTLMAMKIKFPAEGFITPWIIVDIGISVLLISYSADMLSLLISSIARSTTSAMTVMPFILIFQLIFSGGGFFTLPERLNFVSDYTISGYGMTAIAAQADYNSRPMVSGWNQLAKLKDEKIDLKVTPDALADLAGGNEDVKAIAESLLGRDGREISITLGQLLDSLGEDDVRNFIQEKTSSASLNQKFEHTEDNVISCWIQLIIFALLFAVLSVVVLEFIDRDKR